jgi:hypothetical protein
MNTDDRREAAARCVALQASPPPPLLPPPLLLLLLLLLPSHIRFDLYSLLSHFLVLVKVACQARTARERGRRPPEKAAATKV